MAAEILIVEKRGSSGIHNKPIFIMAWMLRNPLNFFEHTNFMIQKELHTAVLYSLYGLFEYLLDDLKYSAQFPVMQQCQSILTS